MFKSISSYEPGTMRLSNHINAEHRFSFASLLSGWATTTDTPLGRMGNKRKVSFPRTSITSSRIEVEVSYLRITSPAVTKLLSNVHYIQNSFT